MDRRRRLYYTVNGDESAPDWSEISLNISGLATVDALAFCDTVATVGYVAAMDATNGHVLRTTDAGASWENTSLTELPTNTGLNALATSGANYVVAGGINSTDGMAAIAS